MLIKRAWAFSPSERPAHSPLAHEYRILSYLRHHTLAPALAFFVDSDGRRCLAIEMDPEQVSLGAWARDHCSDGDFVDWFDSLLEGLSYLHSRGISHGGLRLDSVAVTQTNESGRGCRARFLGLNTMSWHHTRSLTQGTPDALPHPRRGGSIDDLGLRRDVCSAISLAVQVLSLSHGSQALGHNDVTDAFPTIRDSLPTDLAALLERLVSSVESVEPPSAAEVRRELARLRDDTRRASLIQNRGVGERGLVPRRAILSRVRSAMDGRQAGVPVVEIVTGQPGSGKTHLSHLVRVEAALRGLDLVECTARSQMGDHRTLTAEFKEILDEASRESPTFRNPDASVVSADVERPMLSPRPVVCFADDVDCLGDAELAQLLRVSRMSEIGGRCPLLVATCREVPAALALHFPRLAECATRAGSNAPKLEILTLEPLSERETAAFVAEVACVTPDSRLAGFLRSRSGGNPLLVCELTRFLARRGLLAVVNGNLALEDEVGALVETPETIEPVLRESIDSLPADDLAVLDVVSLGLGVLPDVLTRVTGLELPRVQAATARLEEKGILRFDDAGEFTVFAHALLRDIVYDGIESVERSRLHTEVAEFWTGVDSPGGGTTRDEILAWHLRKGESPDSSGAHALRAAQALASAGRCEESETYLAISEDVLGSHASSAPLALESLLRLANAYWSGGHPAYSARACRLGISVAASAGLEATPLAMELQWRLGVAASLSGSPDEASSALACALALAEEQGSREWLARVKCGLGMVLQMTGRFSEFDSLTTEVLSHLCDDDPPDLLVLCYVAKGNARIALSDWDGALPFYEKARVSAEAAGQEDRVSTSLGNIGLAHMSAGRWTIAERCFGEALSTARRIGHHYAMELSLANHAFVLMRRGELDAAAARLREASDCAHRCGDQWGLAVVLANFGELEYRRGNYSAALEEYARAAELMDKAGSIDDKPELLRRTAEVLLCLGRVDEARDAIDSAGAMADKMGGQLEIANAHRVASDIALVEGRDAEAVRLAELALREARALGAEYEAGQCLLSLGRATRLAGSEPDAAAHFERALAVFAELGARRDARLAQDLLGARGPMRRALTPHLPDQRQHLAALCQSSRRIASAGALSDLLREIADAAAASIPAETVAALVRSSDGEYQAVPTSLSSEGDAAPALTTFLGRLLSDVKLEGPEARLLESCDESQLWTEQLESSGVRRALLVPIHSKSEVRGAIYLDYRERDRRFSEQDTRFLEALAAQSAVAIENLMLRAELEDEVEYLRWEVDGRSSFSSIIGRSLEMQKLFVLLQKVSRTSVTVLIEGESGTGKELVARAVHFNGPRKSQKFLAQNCAALPEQLLESELFGHVRGAFTGAMREKAGLFEAVDGGTFFLDEIADMPPSLQVKLLRVLQDGEIRRVGATEPRSVDVRIVAATNKNLAEEVAAGRFREDLFYRLNVIRVFMPPLRERRDDIPLLAQHFLDKYSGGLESPPRGFSDDAMDLLANYDWPGNVRELENEVQRALALAKPGSGIAANVLSDRIRAVDVVVKPIRPGAKLSLKDMVEDVEKRVILQVLNETNWNKSRTAQLLGLSRQGLLKKIARFGLKPLDE
ncbi:MAG: sigma 54-interacting transcriptional regulator [Candidatus Eisenbacteria bacterium]